MQRLHFYGTVSQATGYHHINSEEEIIRGRKEKKEKVPEQEIIQVNTKLTFIIRELRKEKG